MVFGAEPYFKTALRTHEGAYALAAFSGRGTGQQRCRYSAYGIVYVDFYGHAEFHIINYKSPGTVEVEIQAAWGMPHVDGMVVGSGVGSRISERSHTFPGTWT